MRFIEKSDSDLNVVIYYLRKSGGCLEFVLLPMIHLGTNEFFDEMSHRLTGCDLILAEGIKSRKARFLTLPYRVAAKSSRVDLVRQDKALRLSGLKGKILPADLDKHSFDEGWSRLSLTLRVQLLVRIPLMAFDWFFFIDRRTLAESLVYKDTNSVNEKRDEDMEDFARLIGGDRNQALIQTIKELDRSRKREPMRIGIPFGAKHMSRIANFLLEKLGYRVVKIERVKVFNF